MIIYEGGASQIVSRIRTKCQRYIKSTHLLLLRAQRGGLGASEFDHLRVERCGVRRAQRRHLALRRRDARRVLFARRRFERSGRRSLRRARLAGTMNKISRW